MLLREHNTVQHSCRREKQLDEKGTRLSTKIQHKGESYCELISNTADGVTRGKLLGPDGKPFFMLYGPCAAPTRHIGEYEEVMICASGIGVTPLASSMKSIVFDKWPKSRGKCYPARAHFFGFVATAM